MGFGAVVEYDGRRHEIAESGPFGTNNSAEYGGLLAGLSKALELGARAVYVRGDSQLVLNQVFGSWRARNHLGPLRAQAKGLLARFEKVRYEWIPRERNKDADRAADKGAKSARLESVVVPEPSHVTRPEGFHGT